MFAGPSPSIAEITTSLAQGECTARQILEATLHRIERLQPHLNAFSDLLIDPAQRDAQRLDRMPEAERGPLHGVPVAIKQELDVQGAVTTFGGRANRTPAAADSEVVTLLRRAGAVVVGKTCMPEFGQWPFTESEATGITRNPWDTGRSPGGSSGGSAVAVASGMVPVALGGDGGGSIRIPASACGLFGLKPTRGLVTSAPAEHLWWALGCIGPLSRSVIDSARVYDVISAASDQTGPELLGTFVDAAQREPGRLRIGWTLKPPTPGVRVDAEVAAAMEQAVQLFADLGHDVVAYKPRYPDATAAFLPQFFAGVRAEADAVEAADLLEARTKQTLAMGRWVRPGVLRRALALGERVSVRANRIFDDVDVLLTPTLPILPPRAPQLGGLAMAGGSAAAALARSTQMIAYTALWNVTGNPAASLPLAMSRAGLPIGLQLVGPLHGEHRLICLAAQAEAASGWLARRPPLAERLLNGPTLTHPN